jgi:pimeloyl-ACP methyl ester carboxylesterase
MKKNHVTIKNGETLHFLDVGSKDKDVFVLIHGNMSSSIHYKPLIERLQDTYRLIVPDMRGFGDSSYHSPIDSLEDFADDIHHLLQMLDISKYYVAGWSTGGGVALKLAAKHSDEVEKVVLIESCSYRGYPIYKKDENGQPIVGEHYESKAELAKDPVQVAPMLPVFKLNLIDAMKQVWDAAIYTVNKPNEADDKLYLSETLKQRNLVDVDWALTTFNMSNFSNGVSLGDNSIKNVVCPVISFWSEKDFVVLEYMVDETVEALQNVEKVILKDSGHSPLVDCPDELSKLIIEFIE